MTAVFAPAAQLALDPPKLSPRHVLFIMDRLPRTLGGAEGVLLNTIKLLPKDRFRCSVLTFDLEPGSAFEDLTCPLHVLPMRRTYDLNAARMALRLSGLIHSERVDIVHTFFESSDLWGGFVTKMFTSARLISSRRDMGILRSTKHRLAYRVLSSMADRILTVSEQVRHFCIASDHATPDKVITVYNGVELLSRPDPLQRMAFRKQFGIPEASLVVMTVANIRRVKGLDVLFHAAAKICPANQHLLFLIAGGVLEQDYFLELQELKVNLHISDRIMFLGQQENVRPLLEMSDMFVLPSRSEGFSNALLEAMAAELPCIATKVGGNREAIQHGSNGLLVNADDVEGMAEAISELAQDERRARELGRAARESVEIQFTPERMMSDLLRVYESLP